MSGPTKGPWHASPSGPVMRGYSQPYAVGQYGRPNLIAGCFGDVQGGEQVAKANAHLIAAAPDLLAACKEFVRKVEAGEAKSTRSYAQMKAAIAAAEPKP